MMIKSLKKLYFFIVLCSAALFLNGCSLMPESALPAHMITLNLKAAEDINPDTQGQPEPLTLMVFELKNDHTFKTATFFALYKNASQVLANDLVEQQTIYLKPGDRLGVRFTTKREVKFLGILAAYRNIDNARWRLVIPLNAVWGVESKWLDVGKLEIKEKEIE